MKNSNTLVVITKPPYTPSHNALGKFNVLDFGDNRICRAEIIQVLGEGITYRIPDSFDFSFWAKEKVDVKINGKAYKDFLFI